MRGVHRPILLTAIAVVAVAGVVAATVAYAKRPEKPAHPYPPVGIFIQLSEDFHREMGAYGDNTRTLSTDMSETYLRQIAVASRYTVETNLTIIQQQQRIIELLEAQSGEPARGSSPKN